MLNSKKANYSYGNLQDAFTAMFEQTKLPLEELKRVLILGYGAGGVGYYLTQKSDVVEITGVDNSSLLQEVLPYFKSVPRSRLVTDDAAAFVLNDNNTYDMVVVDLYQDLEVPAQFHEASFLDACIDRLSDKGHLVFNKVVQNDVTRAELQDLVIHFLIGFVKFAPTHSLI